MKIIDEIVEQELETDPHPANHHFDPANLEAELQSPTFKLRRGTFIGLLLLLLIFGGAFSALVWKKGAHNETQKPATQMEAVTPAKTSSDIVTVEEDELMQISVEPAVERVVDVQNETTGKVAFNEDRQTPVFTPYSGRVVEVLANRGDVVTQGQPLLVVESPELVATENDLSAARSDQDKTRIALDIAQKTADRMRSLLEKEAVAAKDLQQADADLARVKEEMHRADAAVEVVKNRLALFGKDAKEIAQIEKQPISNLDRRIYIRAPIKGTIVDRQVGPGQYIKSDTPNPLFMLSDLSTLWVIADVYESFLPNIRVGTPVNISVAALADHEFPARVSFINPTVDPATRTVHVRCVVANSKGLLKPEMFAKIKIGTVARQAFPAVPVGAVISHNNVSAVLVEETRGHFRRREIKSARDEQGFTLIESGLKTGERVVTHGVLLLNGGVGKTATDK